MMALRVASIYTTKRKIHLSNSKLSESSNIDKPKKLPRRTTAILYGYAKFANRLYGIPGLMHFGTSPWTIFNVTMTQEERKGQLEKLVRESPKS